MRADVGFDVARLQRHHKGHRDEPTRRSLDALVEDPLEACTVEVSDGTRMTLACNIVIREASSGDSVTQR
jgi:hypothetical protein